MAENTCLKIKKENNRIVFTNQFGKNSSENPMLLPEDYDIFSLENTNFILRDIEMAFGLKIFNSPDIKERIKIIEYFRGYQKLVGYVKKNIKLKTSVTLIAKTIIFLQLNVLLRKQDNE